MSRGSRSWEILFAGVGLSLLALDGTAKAADVTMPVKAPPVQSVFDWTGLYIGAHAGYGRAPASAVLTDPFLNTTATNSASAGMIGGVQAGYNVRLPSGLLVGIEADLTSPNYLISDSIVAVLATPRSEVVEHLDYVGTLRGRLGYARGTGCSMPPAAWPMPASASATRRRSATRKNT